MKKYLTTFLFFTSISSQAIADIDQSQQNTEEYDRAFVSFSINNNFINPLLTETGKNIKKLTLDDKNKSTAMGCTASIGAKSGDIKYDIFLSYTGNQKWNYKSTTDQLAQLDQLLTISGILFGASFHYNLFNIGNASIYGGVGLGYSYLSYSFIEFENSGGHIGKSIFVYPELKISYPVGFGSIELSYSFVKFFFPTFKDKTAGDQYNFSNNSVKLGVIIPL
jgi:hypothetical protein